MFHLNSNWILKYHSLILQVTEIQMKFDSLPSTFLDRTSFKHQLTFFDIMYLGLLYNSDTVAQSSYLHIQPR